MPVRSYSEQLFDHQPTGEKASRQAMLDTLALDVAMVEVVHRDEPELLEEIRQRAAQHFSLHVSGEKVEALELPETVEPEQRLEYLVDVYAKDVTEKAKKAVVEHGLEIQRRSTDTGEIITIPPEVYLKTPEFAAFAPVEKAVELDEATPEEVETAGEDAPEEVQRALGFTALQQRILGLKRRFLPHHQG